MMVEMEPFDWTCPYCGQLTTIVDENFSEGYKRVGTTRSLIALNSAPRFPLLLSGKFQKSRTMPCRQRRAIAAAARGLSFTIKEASDRNTRMKQLAADKVKIKKDAKQKLTSKKSNPVET